MKVLVNPSNSVAMQQMGPRGGETMAAILPTMLLRRWRNVVLAALGWVVIASCTRPASQSRPSTFAQPPAEQPDRSRAMTGEIHLAIYDPAADEGESWDIVVRGDGTFDLTHTWSDGAEDTTDDCRGQLDTTAVRRWSKRFKRSASPDPLPSRNFKGDGSDPDYFYDIRLVDGDADPQYGNPEAVRVDLDAWFAEIRTAATCE